VKKALTKLHIGDKISDAVANAVRTWKFVIFQCIVIALWLFLNSWHPFPYKWDKFPFQLLKLILTIQGFFTASMLLMAQKRQSERDRQVVYNDYIVDVIIKREATQTRQLAQRNNERLDSIEKILGNKP
jgi:uncharacterized membrane protein